MKSVISLLVGVVLVAAVAPATAQSIQPHDLLQVRDLVFVTEYQARSGKREELLEKFEQLGATRDPAGQAVAFWVADLTRPDHFFVVEYWENLDQRAMYLRSPAYEKYEHAIEPLLAAAPRTIRGTPRFLRMMVPDME